MTPRREDEMPSERSDADREAARLERERRRMERQAEIEAQAEAARLAEERASEVPELELEPVTVTVPAEPATAEEPAGIRRVARPSVRDLPEVGATAARPDPPRRVPRTRSRRRVGLGVVGVVALVALVVVAYFAYRVYQPFTDDGDGHAVVRVTIPAGSTAGEVGDILAAKGVIDSSFFFGLRTRVDGKRGDLKAGTFTLHRDMSYAAAIDALTKNPPAPVTVRVTIPEGRSIAEAAPLVRSQVTGSYVKAASRPPRTVSGLRAYGAPKGTSTLEGFLFPATYELRPGATAQSLVDQQLAAFRRTFDPLDRKAAHRRGLTDYDILIIASMIEREAQVPKDRALISAVIANRLKQHIPLGIDATLRYRLNNWTKPLRQSELQTDSAFNTRLHQGLPPTPIGSPGLASIKAALSPAKVPYLFYVVKPCGNGAHAFSSTDAQFAKDVAAYNKKRDQLGGKDPSSC